MFCPQCEQKFPWHVMVCPTCDVDTVDRLPGPEPLPDVELVCAYTSRDTGLIALARSVLDDEEIDYFVKGEGHQDLFGLGRNTGFSEAMRAAEFWVRADDAERVRDLLEGLSASGQQGKVSDGES
jgi:hypothetical protein